MVTERNNSSSSAEFRKAFSGYLRDFATTVTLRKPVETTDGMGRVTSVSTSTTTIRADIQWVTKNDIDHGHQGQFQIGDGFLFVEHDADVDIEDEIEYNSVRYRIDSQIEGEQVKGNVVYRGFLIKKNLQS